MNIQVNVTHIVGFGEGNRVIGNSKTTSKMPEWFLPADMKHFKQSTEGYTIIMGRPTYDSLPDGWRPLPNRNNIIVTRNMNYFPDPKNEDTYVAHSIDEAVILAESIGADKEIFIGGGGDIYLQSFNHPMVNVVRIIATIVHGEFEGDVFYPEIPEGYKEVSREFIEKQGRNTHDFSIVTYELAA